MSDESLRIKAWGRDFQLTAQQNGLLKRMVTQVELLARAMPIILALPGVNGISFSQQLTIERPIIPTDGEYIEFMVTIRLVYSELSSRVDKDLRENEVTAPLYDPNANIRVCMIW